MRTLPHKEYILYFASFISLVMLLHETGYLSILEELFCCMSSLEVVQTDARNRNEQAKLACWLEVVQ